MADLLDKPKGIYEALPKIMAAVGAVAKNGTNTQGQGYKFRAVDDVMASVQAVLAKHGVAVWPEVKAYTCEQVHVGKNNTTMMHVLATIAYHWTAADGSEIVSVALGEAMDSGDKAANKAMAAAYKYAVTQTLSIPTSEPKDTENDSPELSEGFVPISKAVRTMPEALKMLVSRYGKDECTAYRNAHGLPGTLAEVDKMENYLATMAAV